MENLSIFIESGANQTIKLTASLFEKKGREKSGLFVIEGERFVSELLAGDVPVQPSYFMAAEGFAQKRDMAAYETAAPLYIVRDAAFKQLSDVETPQGILAVCKQRHCAPEDLCTGDAPILLVLEEMQDPGNVGTILRTADAAGLDGVILSAGAADVYNPKVLRAAAGALFRIPVAAGCDLAAVIPMLQAHSISVYAAVADTGCAPYACDFTRGTAVLIGNEARGLSAEAAALADTRITLPMPGRAESLNAAMAGGILVYEAVRQRQVL